MILLISPKDKYATKRLVEEAGKRSVAITVMDMQDLVACGFQIDISRYSCLYIRQAFPFFKEISAMARKFKEAGTYIVDGDFITNGFDTSKWEMYQGLEKAGCLIPRTSSLSGCSAPPAHYPFVLKWKYGFGGKDVLLIRNEFEFLEMKKNHPDSEWLVQEYIEADKEFEIYVLGGRAVLKVLSFEIKNGFKADVHKCTVIQNSNEFLDFPKLITLAEDAALALGRELSKVDILESRGRLIVLEVNRTPGLISFESLIGYNMAGEFIEFLTRKDNPMILNEKPDITVPQQPSKPQEPIQPQA